MGEQVETSHSEGKQLAEGHPWASSRTRDKIQVCQAGPWLDSHMGLHQHCCTWAGTINGRNSFSKPLVPSRATLQAGGLVCGLEKERSGYLGSLFPLEHLPSSAGWTAFMDGG